MDKDCVTQVESLTKIIVKFRAEKFCAHLYHAPNILLNQGHNIIHEHDQRLCSNTLKRNKLKVDISLKGNKLARFENS